MENYIKYGNRPNIERRRLRKACQIDEIKMVRPRRQNVQAIMSKTSTPGIYCRSKIEEKAQEEMIPGRGAGYGKNGDKMLEGDE